MDPSSAGVTPTTSKSSDPNEQEDFNRLMEQVSRMNIQQPEMQRAVPQQSPDPFQQSIMRIGK